MSKKRLSWKKVANSDMFDLNAHHNYLPKFIEFLRGYTDYKFVLWNDRVYEFNEITFWTTEFTKSDIK